MADSRLHQMAALGQSPWIDYLSLELIESGELERLMREDAIAGVTSNPTILQKAISSGNAYDPLLRELLRDEDDPRELFIGLATDNVRRACDLFRLLWESGARGRDGNVSLEVDPGLASDTNATIEQAARLSEAVDRPNLYVKIPATKPGLPAIEEMVSRGVPINVTLIFSLERYKEVVEAYLRGVERLVEGGGDPSTVTSVASFFVSRVDTEADRRLDEVGHPELKGKLAIANAKLAYQHYREIFAERALGLACSEGRDPAVLPLGVHVHEEPGVPRRALRRGARSGRTRWTRCRRRRSRRSRITGTSSRGSNAGSTRRTRSSSRSPRRESTTTTWSRRSSARASRSSPSPSTS